MNANESHDTALVIAGEVLAQAALVDRRIEVTEAVIAGWARYFDGKKVWPEEAVDAVIHHYSQPNQFSIIPGDVLAYCAHCPVYSSREHAAWFLDFWAQFPYSEEIEAHTGMRPPTVSLPDHVTPEKEREYLIERLRKWIADNHDALIAAILRRRYPGTPQ